MEVDVVSLCPEFPNDNPSLHRGVSWVCLDVIGGAVAVREHGVEPSCALAVECVPEVAAEIAEISQALADAIEPERKPPSVSVAELVATFEIEREQEQEQERKDEPIQVPASRISGVVPVGQHLHLEDDDLEDDEILVEELPPLDETACVVEGTEEVAAEERVAAAEERVAAAVAAPVPTPTPTTLPPAPDDPFTVLLTTLADVAIGAGSPHVASLLPGLLLEGRLAQSMPAAAAQALAEAKIVDGTEVTPTFAAQTLAWRAILDGTSEDFAACGSAMLDEWAAELLARLLGAPTRATALRRELRERGVAAFGLVEAA